MNHIYQSNSTWFRQQLQECVGGGRRSAWAAAGRVPRAGGVFARVRAATHLAGGRASEGRGRAPTSVRREVGRVAPPQGKRGRWGGRRRHKAGTGVREGGAWRTAANPTSRFACFNRVVKGDKAMGISIFSLGDFFYFLFFSPV